MIDLLSKQIAEILQPKHQIPLSLISNQCLSMIAKHIGLLQLNECSDLPVKLH